jgi:hypothetical protein
MLRKILDLEDELDGTCSVAERTDKLEDVVVDGRIILKLILKTAWIGFICLRLGSKSGCFEDCDEPSSFIKGEKFLDQLKDCFVLKKDSVP